MRAEYLIIQYVADPMRREGVNVGVVVRVGESFAACFVGETLAGEIDLRQVAGMPFPRVYRQWVKYWRRTLAEKPDAWGEIRQTARFNYAVLDGGEVYGTGGDGSPQDVADHLFGRLVTPRRFLPTAPPPLVTRAEVEAGLDEALRE